MALGAEPGAISRRVVGQGLGLSVAVLFLLIAAAASGIPARRAARISPAETLRRE